MQAYRRRNRARTDAQPGRNCKEDHSGLPRGTISPTSQWLAAFIDVGRRLSLLLRVLLRQNFPGGSLVEWGTFPEQRKRYFSKQGMRLPQ